MKKITITASFLPGIWKRPARWNLTHDNCVFERDSIEQARETVADHMRDYHAVSDELDIEWRYAINGIDITDDVEAANDARAAAEEADRVHKLTRLNFSLMMREQGATVEAIGQLLGYQLSTVASLLRDKPSKFEEPEPEKSEE